MNKFDSHRAWPGPTLSHQAAPADAECGVTPPPSALKLANCELAGAEFSDPCDLCEGEFAEARETSLPEASEPLSIDDLERLAPLYAASMSIWVFFGICRLEAFEFLRDAVHLFEQMYRMHFENGPAQQVVVRRLAILAAADSDVMADQIESALALNSGPAQRRLANQLLPCCRGLDPLGWSLWSMRELRYLSNRERLIALALVAQVLVEEQNRRAISNELSWLARLE